MPIDTHKPLAVAAFLLLATACSPGTSNDAAGEPPDAPAAGAWVGTVTTEGDVTAVFNESGSVWGDGAPKATSNTGASFQILTSEMLVLGNDDVLWVPAIDFGNRLSGYARLGPDGNAGEPHYPPVDDDWRSGCLTYTRRGQEGIFCGVPFQPSPVNALTPDGAWAVGIPEDYLFEVIDPGGSVLRVERAWDPVPVSSEEAAYRKQQTTELVRQRIAVDPAWTWTGPEIPDHKPAYVQLMPDRNGRIWALREQRSRLSTDCADDTTECWVPEGYWLDAFGADGRFLGSVTIDRRPTYRPFIDDAGTIMVKRYRLALPGERIP